MRRALSVLATSAWLAFATWRLLSQTALLPNGLAGDVVQSGAALAILLLALHGARVPLGAAIPLALAVVASVALGHPWRNVPPAPLLALLMLPALALGRKSALVALLAWAAFAGAALAGDPEPRVALVSHVAPGTLALAPLLLRRAWPRRKRSARTGSPEHAKSPKTGGSGFSAIFGVSAQRSAGERAERGQPANAGATVTRGSPSNGAAPCDRGQQRGNPSTASPPAWT